MNCNELSKSKFKKRRMPLTFLPSLHALFVVYFSYHRCKQIETQVSTLLNWRQFFAWSFFWHNNWLKIFGINITLWTKQDINNVTNIWLAQIMIEWSYEMRCNIQKKIWSYCYNHEKRFVIISYYFLSKNRTWLAQ